MNYVQVEVQTPSGAYSAEMSAECTVGELLKALSKHGALPQTLGNSEAAFEVRVRGLKVEDGTVIDIIDRCQGAVKWPLGR